MGILKKIKSIFKKEEEVTFPPEYCVVTYSQIALRNGIEDECNKIIIRYRYNYKIERFEVYKVYGYSTSLFNALRKKLKIPIYDQTKKETKFPIYDEIDLSEVSYYKA